MTGGTLQPDDVDRIRSYLELSDDVQLPQDPLQLLADHVDTLPRSLLQPFAECTTPRERARIRTIKSRRVMHASTVPPPAFLSADAGRLRWPLLWERMGGSSLLPPSRALREEESWVREKFQGGEQEGADGQVHQHVKKLGGLLRDFEEEREMEHARERKRVERRMEEEGEEFDSESDEEDGGTANAAVGSRMAEAEDQESVVRAFEKKLVELFVDGLDSVSYDDIDFSEPAGGDPIALRDAQDRYFDDEEPSRTPNGHDQGSNVNRRLAETIDSLQKQNGQGDYDY